MKASFRLQILMLVALLSGCGQLSQSGSGDIERAFNTHATNVQVTGEGTVLRVLSDDRSGPPHQRIIIRLASGQTVLIQHNIDVAKRIDDLKVGDTVGFSGEYIWNDQGGLIHWTHHDPAGHHTGGWLKHNGRTYD
ncbi:MAG: DUF3465 domain-containing protein [Chloracidobacterium sp.]|nr:DUF3465 domain-containing protein [Chloracidobacterium sp.]